MLSRIQNRSHTDLGWRFGDIYPNFVTITGTCSVFACSREAERNEHGHAVSAQARCSWHDAPGRSLPAPAELRRQTRYVPVNRSSLGLRRDPSVLILVASVKAAGLVFRMAAPRIRHCVAEWSNGDRGTRCATSLEGGREARKRLWRERNSAMKLGADLVSRGHRYRPLARSSAQLCARRRRSCAPPGARSSPSIQGTGDASGTRTSAVRGMVRFAASQTLLRPEPVMQSSGPNIVLLLVLTRFAGLAVGASGQAGSLPARGRRLWPGGREDNVGRITVAVFEAASAAVAVTLHVADHGLHGGSPPQLAFDDTEDAAL